MDRRQQKTQAAIFTAFATLLGKKQYKSITVQDIIDEANIGRSTFYAHFETKDELLKSMCTIIFDHVFNKTLPQESAVENQHGSNNMELKLAHTLYHLEEKKDVVKSLIRSDSSDLLMTFFKDYLQDLFKLYLKDFPPNVPEDFLLNYLVGSFSETIKWWILNDTKDSPEQIAQYYMTLLRMD